jgi:L-threonylcarbamoyladenylate synthase
LKTITIPFNESAISQALQALREGAVLAFPTDTVYGIGVPAFSPAGIERLYAIKERSNLKAIPILIGALEQLTQVSAGMPDYAARLTRRLWPGALTVILPIHTGLPKEISPTPTIGVRMPDHDLLRQLITLSGPLAVTSANLSGQPNSVSAADVLMQLGGRVDLLLDGGSTPGDVPSTVVDCTGERAKVLRWGVIGRDVLEEALGENPG